VRFDALAAEQAEWIEARTALPIAARIRATLALGATPHPYRRIRRTAQGMQLAVEEWRVSFAAVERDLRVIEIRSGFRPAQLADEARRPHREFQALWPSLLFL
jgi:hypothetical protein